MLRAGDGDGVGRGLCGDGTWLATISGVGVLHRWDVTSGAGLGAPVAVPGARIVRIPGVTASRCVGARHDDLHASVRGRRAAKPSVTPAPWRTSSCRTISLVSAGADGLVCEWDVTSGEHIALRGHGSR